ncbi:hypothetical protein Daus18300_001559 [Diaporthe australafricana]|uniref:Uncharacterized protein n=1 Tax=Diaporthe australafricana TaxID=127596 RepID=A0ABR3XUP1_9PEZI
MAIDGRFRTDPPVHPRTMGCFLEYVAVEMPIRKILTYELADIALEIRKSVMRANKNWTDEIPFTPFSAASASASANADLKGDWEDTFAAFYADPRMHPFRANA